MSCQGNTSDVDAVPCTIDTGSDSARSSIGSMEKTCQFNHKTGSGSHAACNSPPRTVPRDTFNQRKRHAGDPPSDERQKKPCPHSESAGPPIGRQSGSLHSVWTLRRGARRMSVGQRRSVSESAKPQVSPKAAARMHGKSTLRIRTEASQDTLSHIQASPPPASRPTTPPKLQLRLPARPRIRADPSLRKPLKQQVLEQDPEAAATPRQSTALTEIVNQEEPNHESDTDAAFEQRFATDVVDQDVLDHFTQSKAKKEQNSVQSQEQAKELLTEESAIYLGRTRRAAAALNSIEREAVEPKGTDKQPNLSTRTTLYVPRDLGWESAVQALGKEFAATLMGRRKGWIDRYDAIHKNENGKYRVDKTMKQWIKDKEEREIKAKEKQLEKMIDHVDDGKESVTIEDSGHENDELSHEQLETVFDIVKPLLEPEGFNGDVVLMVSEEDYSMHLATGEDLEPVLVTETLVVLACVAWRDLDSYTRCMNPYCAVPLTIEEYFCGDCNDRDQIGVHLCLKCFQHLLTGINETLNHRHPREHFRRRRIPPTWLEFTGSLFKERSLLFAWDRKSGKRCLRRLGYLNPGHLSSNRIGGVLVRDKFMLQNHRDTSMTLSSAPQCVFCGRDDFDEAVLGEIGKLSKELVYISDCEGSRHAPKRGSGYYPCHLTCVKFADLVHYNPQSNTWYNIDTLYHLSKQNKCSVCQHPGATLGCMTSRCRDVVHVPCADINVKLLEEGILYWCKRCRRESYNQQTETFKCDGCSVPIKLARWTCKQCETKSYPWKSFDLCRACFWGNRGSHHHDRCEFKSVRVYSEGYQRKLAAPRPRFGTNSTPKCIYCLAEISDGVRCGRTGVGGGPICISCALVCFEHSELGCPNGAKISAEEYDYNSYLTRYSLSTMTNNDTRRNHLPKVLPSYGPHPKDYYSIHLQHSYMDIPGRIRRWATHDYGDYLGTWIPQIPRWAILRYTAEGDRVLSNFAGRGTDLIECFLLSRKSVGVDINPLAVGLSHRNLAFAVPVKLQRHVSSRYRPLVIQDDAAALRASIFKPDMFDLVLSHPPYSNCIVYSTQIAEDLSNQGDHESFFEAYLQVARSTHRVVKPDGHVLLGIGDNRMVTRIVPVGFKTIMCYLREGFVIEELIVKRQKYCSGTMDIGALLAAMHGFLILTHEYLAVFRRRKSTDVMIPSLPLWTEVDAGRKQNISCFRIPRLYGPSNTAVMGTTWLLCSCRDMELQAVTKLVLRYAFEGDICGILGSAGRPDWVETTKKRSKKCFCELESRKQRKDLQELQHAEESEYERQRLENIKSNEEALARMGLKQPSTDVLQASVDRVVSARLKTRFTVCSEAVIDIMIIFSTLAQSKTNEGLSWHDCHMITADTVARTKSALHSLRPGCSRLAVACSDFRTSQGIVYPGAMYLEKHLHEPVRNAQLGLKEIIIMTRHDAACNGWSKKRHPFKRSRPFRWTMEPQMSNAEHLPIVHWYFLLYEPL
eukprot:Clim_evm16s199 gene=Clim_evmTU16s199